MERKGFPEGELLALLAFFEKRPGTFELYQAVEAGLVSALPPFTRAIQKTQITFYNPGVFACISLPRFALPAEQKGSILLSLGLPAKPPSPRIVRWAEPRPGRATCHILLSDPGELDGELLDWLSQAYDFAKWKKGRRG